MFPVGLAVVLLVVAAGPAAAEPAETFSVTFGADGRLSLDVGTVPLRDVLEAIAAQTGAELTVHGDLGTTSPQRFRQARLEDGLERLGGVRGLAVVVVYGPPAADGRVVVREILVAASDGSRGPATTIGAGSAPADGGRLLEVSRLARRRDAEGLGRLLLEDPSPEIRRQAAAALGRVGTAGRSPLLAALGDPDVRVRVKVVEGLGRVGGEDAVAALRGVLAGAGDSTTRTVAVWALARFPGAGAAAALDAARLDADQQVSQAAEQALRSWSQRFGSGSGAAGR
jgi:hypothetical protein